MSSCFEDLYGPEAVRGEDNTLTGNCFQDLYGSNNEINSEDKIWSKKMNKPNKYRAKLKSNAKITVEGYYFEMKETTYCFTEDYEKNPVPTHYYLICEHMTDWGLPNKAEMFEIDINTLEEVI